MCERKPATLQDYNIKNTPLLDKIQGPAEIESAAGCAITGFSEEPRRIDTLHGNMCDLIWVKLV